MAHDVFISYPHENKAVADIVCATLEAKGIRCWIAPRDIAPSADWAGSIIDAIDISRVMILIFSSETNRSRQVAREVQHAFDGEKPVVPFRIENVAPQGLFRYYMGSVHWLDALAPPFERHLQSLVMAVRALLGGPQYGHWESGRQAGPSVKGQVASVAQTRDNSRSPKLPQDRFTWGRSWWLVLVMGLLIGAVAVGVIKLWAVTPPPASVTQQLPALPPPAVTQQPTVSGPSLATTAPAAHPATVPNNLAQIFSRGMFGAQVAYLEHKIGPAMHVFDVGKGVQNREYVVDGCNVTATAEGAVINRYSLDLTPQCNFNLNTVLPDYPSTAGLTVGKFANGPLGRDLAVRSHCIALCGNAADPTIDFIFEGAHAENFVYIALTVILASDLAIGASDKWETLMKSKEGEDYITKTKFNCDQKYAPAAVRYFSDVPVDQITVGYAPPDIQNCRR